MVRMRLDGNTRQVLEKRAALRGRCFLQALPCTWQWDLHPACEILVCVPLLNALDRLSLRFSWSLSRMERLHTLVLS